MTTVSAGRQAGQGSVGSCPETTRTGSDFSCFLKGRMNGLEGKEERERRIEERNGSVSRVPPRDAFVFGVDEERHSPRLAGGQQASSSGGEQELSAQAVALDGTGDRKPGQSENRHLVPGETPGDKPGGPVVGDRSGTDAVKPKDRPAVAVVDGEKRLGTSLEMALARMAPEEVVQRGVAAIERFPVMCFGYRLFVPRRQGHRDCGKACAAASSFVLGAGGLSKRSSARRLSRSES